MNALALKMARSGLSAAGVPWHQAGQTSVDPDLQTGITKLKIYTLELFFMQ